MTRLSKRLKPTVCNLKEKIHVKHYTWINVPQKLMVTHVVLQQNIMRALLVKVCHEVLIMVCLLFDVTIYFLTLSGLGVEVPAAYNSKIIHDIEMKFGRVVENHKPINLM